MVAFGFCSGERAYVKSPWNLLDLMIVTVSILVLLAEFFPVFEGLKVLRVLRVLRPLRLLARNAGMKLIIVSLFKCAPAVSNVFGVILAFQLVFAILGMQIFMGRLGSCTDETILLQEACHSPADVVARHLAGEAIGADGDGSGGLWGELGGSARSLAIAGGPLAAVSSGPLAAAAGSLSPTALLDYHRHHHQRQRRLKGGGGSGGGAAGGLVQWVNPALGDFDSFSSAMIVLFIMSTGDGFDSLMFTVMDATEAGHGPVRNDFSLAAFFVVLWVFVGNLFAINLFVGVVVDNFNRIKNESENAGTATMTHEQQQWVETMKSYNSTKPQKAPRPPSGILRGACFQLVTSSAFDGFIIGVILANVGVMACDYWGIEGNVADYRAYNTSLLTFGYIYYAECILKLLGLGPSNYFGDAW